MALLGGAVWALVTDETLMAFSRINAVFRYLSMAPSRKVTRPNFLYQRNRECNVLTPIVIGLASGNVANLVPKVGRVPREAF